MSSWPCFSYVCFLTTSESVCMRYCHHFSHLLSTLCSSSPSIPTLKLNKNCWNTLMSCFLLSSGPNLPLCRLYHGRGPRRQWGLAARRPPINCQIFTTLFDVWTFSVGLNVTTTTKKVVNFGEGRKVYHQRKKCTTRENPGYAYEKKAPAWRWYGAPEWLIRPCLSSLTNLVYQFPHGFQKPSRLLNHIFTRPVQSNASSSNLVAERRQICVHLGHCYLYLWDDGPRSC